MNKCKLWQNLEKYHGSFNKRNYALKFLYHTAEVGHSKCETLIIMTTLLHRDTTINNKVRRLMFRPFTSESADAFFIDRGLH